MENHKRRLLTYVEEDKVSNLPEHLIGSILDRLRIQEAVRTSILSKNWRYKWTTLTTLVLNEKFSKKFAKDGALGRDGFIRIINQVVLLNKGPISKFSLHIPEIYPDSFHEEVDEWMLFLSENSVRELIITNSSRRFELSSHVFCCSKLRKLRLNNCILRPPLEFERFSNLEDLYLKLIDFGAKDCETLVSLPQLKSLTMFQCTNIHNFNIEARKLNIFRITNLDATYIPLLDRLLVTPSITILLCVIKPLEVRVGVERMNLTTMSSNLPNIRELTIDGHFLKFLTADKFPKWLPHALNSLRVLWLGCIRFGDLDQLHGALCLLRNSPNLERLWMWLKPVMRNDVGPASNHLESPDCLDQTLNRLQTVEVKHLEGSRPELLFIKLLLAHSPSLNKMTIEPSRDCDSDESGDIDVDIMRFPRASPKAKLIFVDG